MAEYYIWVNFDKQEYLCPGDFDLGNKSHESVFKENSLLRALRELLSTEWRGCRLVFLGDEIDINCPNTNKVFQNIWDHVEQMDSSEHIYDMITGSFRNISCLFKDAEVVVREEIEYYLAGLKDGQIHFGNEYGMDENDPFRGLFSKEGKTFQYTLNHSKRIGYSLNKTRILCQDGSVCGFADPLPILLGCGRCMEPGPWVGDVIGVDDALPSGHTLLKEIYLDW